MRVAFARQVGFCGTPDACFYLATAKTLATEHRFHARFLFDLQLAHLAVPNTGLEYWRPGTSFFLLLAKLFGISLFSSIVVAILAGVVLALAARHIARQLPATVPGRDLVAPAAFCLCLIWRPLWDGSASPDSALFYGAAVAWFLALFTPRRQGPVQDGIALVCVSAAYLIRNDAALLLVPLLAVLWRRHRAHRAGNEVAGGSPAAILFILVGFFVALTPMHLIYKAVLGTAFPSGAAQALFLDDLSDFVRYNDPVGPHTLLAHGLGHLVKARIGTGFLIGYRVGALMLGYPALVLLAGLWAARREPPVRPAVEKTGFDLTGPLVFAVTLFGVYTFLLPAIGVFSALRSAVGLLPTAAVLTVLAIQRVARTPRIAMGVLLATLAAYTVSGIMDDRRLAAPMHEVLEHDLAQADGLRRMGADPGTAVIMTPDPVQFSVTTGFAAIAEPNNGLDAIVQECRDLGATHVMLDSEHLPAPLEEMNRALRPVHVLRLEGQHALLLQLAPAR